MTTDETTTEDTTPQVYVASLSDYNEGRLFGRWFEFEDYADADDLLAAIGEMLKGYDSLYPLPFGAKREEWAAHDYQDFPSHLYSEHLDLNTVYAYLGIVASMDDERKAAFDIFINAGNSPDEFDDGYMGKFGDRPYDDDYTAREYAESTFWEQHTEQDIPASVRDYIDFSSMANDLVLGGTIWVSNGHVFRS